MRIRGRHLERFWSKVERIPFHECWEWTTSMLHGYGRFTVGRRNIPAHRFAYEAFVGPIPPGLQLDHLCRNRSCVRPDHLEAVTPRENILRGVSWTAINARKTACPNGHPLSGDNLVRSRAARGRRKCLICHRESHRLGWHRRRAEAPRG